MPLKYWNIPDESSNKKIASRLSHDCDIPSFIAQILANRKINSFIQAREFINDDMEFEDPFSLEDMDISVDRIKTAIDEFQKIAVYGDYDCDGVTSTALLFSYLESQGANVIFYIPKRETEGYGMNKNAVRFLKDENVDLIITVDNGISAVEEVALANSLGMDVIITDHHQAGDFLPDAFSIINPHKKSCQSSFKLLAGVGVTFKLVTALEDCNYDYTFSQYADLVAIGTVADIVPLVGENRSIVKLGIEAIKNTDNIGLLALLEVSKVKMEAFSSQSIAFAIAPRINSAGRMADASLAVNLLLSEDIEDARNMALQIDCFNQSRKSQEETILLNVKSQIAQNPSILNDRVLVCKNTDWHHGVIGITCSKLLELFGKPNFLLSSDGDSMRGSARSLGEFSIYNALSFCSEHLNQYGGHKLAGGLSLNESDFDNFNSKIQEYAKLQNKIMPVFTYNIDKVILQNELNLENIKALSNLEPFGSENQQPIFLFQNTTIKEIIPLSNNKHVKLKLDFQNIPIQALLFGISTDDFLFSIGQSIDFVAQISINTYLNNEYLSIVIKDIHPSGFSQKGFFLAQSYYQMFKRDEPLSSNIIQKATPNRDDIAIIYKYLKNKGGYVGDIDLLYTNFISHNINYFKYRIILDVLCEANLISVSPLLDKISLCPVTQKADLNNTDTLKKLTTNV